jgi:aryl-alcohol dehydrogenase-like predicted oxidoreductase
LTRRQISAPSSRASRHEPGYEYAGGRVAKTVCGEEKRKSVASALAWLLAQKPFIVPIPGTRNIDHLNENLGGINVELTAADLRDIEAAFSKITIHDERMSEQHMQQIDRTV